MKRIYFFLLLLVPFVMGSCCEEQSPKVRNVIYMIGDGMGLGQVSMLQIENDFQPTSFDKAQGIALITTRSLNNRVTDSAAAGTALSSGEKTNNSVLGNTPEGEPIESMMAKATKKGLQTGLVVTCYLQHATPGAFYAHVPYRRELENITRDMVKSKVDVLVGGGRKWLSEKCDVEGYEAENYFEAFQKQGYQLADDMEAFKQVEQGRVLAAVTEKHLPHAPERGNYLPEAVAQTLKILENNSRQSEKGFLVMVEGSQIDKAAHANEFDWMLAEMRDFDKAIQVAMDFADRTPGTLVVVVADHETGGLTMPSANEDFTKAESGVRYEFSTHGHTGIMIPVYLYGAGVEEIQGVMDNTELAKKIMSLLELTDEEK